MIVECGVAAVRYFPEYRVWNGYDDDSDEEGQNYHRWQKVIEQYGE